MRERKKERKREREKERVSRGGSAGEIMEKDRKVKAEEGKKEPPEG
jgi:hypothetical protein